MTSRNKAEEGIFFLTSLCPSGHIFDNILKLNFYMKYEILYPPWPKGYAVTVSTHNTKKCESWDRRFKNCPNCVMSFMNDQPF